MTNMKTPPNTAALNNIKNQGWTINIVHWRLLKKDAYVPHDGRQGLLIRDRDYRESLKGYESLKSDDDYCSCWTFEVSHFGGATEIILERGEEKIVVRADCHVKDRFSRRLGVKTALDKLKKLYDIS